MTQKRIWRNSFFFSVALPRTLVREIGNVTICGLRERRNETVRACKIKIISWRHFKKTVKQWWPNNRSQRTGFLWWYEWALALMAFKWWLVHFSLRLWNHRLRGFHTTCFNAKVSHCRWSIWAGDWGVKENHNQQCQYLKTRFTEGKCCLYNKWLEVVSYWIGFL